MVSDTLTSGSAGSLSLLRFPTSNKMSLLGEIYSDSQTQTCLFDIIISRNTIDLTCRVICRETPIKTVARVGEGGSGGGVKLN